ncbi:uncharacterized protein [Lepeophtheirus salmonis]|uniref:c-Myc-binding protein n=1 Tax=Lepeophtheirus salmonis TaxID=72036 RepID=C1BUD5_LEPSM|nr:c-Myc-binding protein homolog [Lepeophtheirus salmonis]ACO12638.1 C-Myc-binding protein [Lepeophtheirus salmonis]ADD24482.1 C-Myc-binding protein [Lepeophtheirus salmonis]
MSAKSGNPIDAKREEFRKYLEREGILQSLTSVLVSLYEEPEKPKDGLIYLKNNFARGTNTSQNEEELEKLKERNASLLEKIEELEKQNADLEKELETMKQMKQGEGTSVSEPKNEAVEEEDEEESQDKMESEEATVTSLGDLSPAPEQPLVDDKQPAQETMDFNDEEEKEPSKPATTTEASESNEDRPLGPSETGSSAT